MSHSARRSTHRYTHLLAIGLAALFSVPARATPPNPIVSSIFVPVEGDILEPGTTNTLHLTGEIHVLTQVTFSDTGVPSVGIWANLVRVRGTSAATGVTYLGVGAGNVAWVGTNPGPPDIPERRLDMALVSLSISPGPPETPPSPVLPVFLRDFHFGAEDRTFGRLMTVDASLSR